MHATVTTKQALLECVLSANLNDQTRELTTHNLYSTVTR